MIPDTSRPVKRDMAGPDNDLHNRTAGVESFTHRVEIRWTQKADGTVYLALFMRPPFTAYEYDCIKWLADDLSTDGHDCWETPVTFEAKAS